ncbi:MAG: hypothetical protein ACP5G4_07825, partial [bacterium]
QGTGVFGVAGSPLFGGVRAYNTNSLNQSWLATGDYAGEFDGGLYLIPGTAPLAQTGAIYSSSADNNLYYHDGTSWVDLTAGGGGGGQWEDAGAYKRVIGNDAVRAYESGQSHGLYAEVPRTTGGTHHALYSEVTGDATATAYGLKSYSGVYGGGGMGGTYYGVYSEAEWGDNSYGLYGISYSAIFNSYGVYGYGGNSSTYAANVYGVFGEAESDYGTKYGIYGTASGAGTNWAGYFNGDVHITGDLTVDGTFPGVGGSGVDNYLARWDGTSDIQTSDIYITDTGRMGFGTTTPDYQIDIQNTSGPAWIRAKSGDSFAGLMIDRGTTTDNGYIQFRTAGTEEWFVGQIGMGSANSDFSISTSFSPADGKFYLTQAGNLGINTTAPTTRLDVNGQIRIRGGVPGAGKVLTSDATGTATWETPTGGTGLWTNAGTHISANTNTNARVYDEGQPYGLYYQGSNKYGVYGGTSNATAGASGVYGYSSTSTAGTGYGYNNSITAVKGHCLYGNAYHFGVHGDTYSSDGSPTAGVIGTFIDETTIWGALAYKHTDASIWAGYFNGDVNITGDLTVDGDFVHDHWGETWTGTGSHGLSLSNTDNSSNQVDIATDVNGITVTHYNYGDAGAAIYAMEGDGTAGGTYSYAKLAWYEDGSTPLTPANIAVYGRIPAAGGGGFAIYGENTRTGSSDYAGYFNGRVKVEGTIDVGQNPYCVTLTAGEALVVGDVVAVSTTANLTVVKATTGSEMVIGVVAEAAGVGAPVKIAVGGVVQVRTSAAVTRANFARVGTTAGQAIGNGTSGSSGDFGIFLETTSGAGLAWMMFKKAEIY